MDKTYKYHYYGATGDWAWHLPSNNADTMIKRWLAPKLFLNSDLVWCQGPQGGVRLVHQDWTKTNFVFRKQGYITTDPEAMKEFMWVKLKAITLSS